jgi:hypothetical protein
MAAKNGSRYIQKAEHLSLNVDEKYALETYIKDSDEINNFLRNINIDKVSSLSIEHAQKLSRLIDEIITDVSKPTSGEIVVWRGIRKGDFNLKNINPGDELTMLSRGILSTSFSKKVAERFSQTGLRLLLKLTIPPQFSALYLGNISEFDEKEVILPHDSKFVVTEKKTLPSGHVQISAICTMQKATSGDIVSPN